jgi:predicted ATPase
MEPVIRSLTVEGFRSIRSEVVDFDNPTFLVGRNGSGKSNLLDALVFLSSAMTTPLTEVFSWRGGGRVVCYGSSGASEASEDRTLGLGVVLGELGSEVATARYAIQVTVKATKRPSYVVRREQCIIRGHDGRCDYFERLDDGAFRSNVAGFEPRLGEDALALRLIGGDARFAPVFNALDNLNYYSINLNTLRQWQTASPGDVLYADGSNAASVLQEIADHEPDNFQRICELMEAIVPTIKRIDVKEYGGRLELEFTQRWDGGPNSLTLGATAMSDGTLRALGLLAAVYQKRLPSLMAIEEPEATIHPGAIGIILDVLRHASERTQVIVTTHSPEVLDADWLEDQHIRIVSWQEGATRVTPLDIGSREALRQHLMTAGELLRSNALEGMPAGRDTTPQPALFQDIVA